MFIYRPTDYTRGIFQSIGFKEFHQYLVLSEEERATESGQKKFIESLDNLKLATRRYARKQNKIIKNRFLGHPSRQVVSFIVIVCFTSTMAIQNAMRNSRIIKKILIKWKHSFSFLFKEKHNFPGYE